jgi:hypothetical protein
LHNGYILNIVCFQCDIPSPSVEEKNTKVQLLMPGSLFLLELDGWAVEKLGNTIELGISYPV